MKIITSLEGQVEREKAMEHRLAPFNVKEKGQIQEVFECIIHTVLFHRQLELVDPKDVTLSSFPHTYVQTSEQATLDYVKYKSGELQSLVSSHNSKQIAISLKFKNFPKSTYFGLGQQQTEWERWVITIGVSEDGTETDIGEYMLDLLTEINDSILSIPDPKASKTSTAISNFPFEIEFQDNRSGTWLTNLKLF